MVNHVGLAVGTKNVLCNLATIKNANPHVMKILANHHAKKNVSPIVPTWVDVRKSVGIQACALVESSLTVRNAAIKN